MQAPFYHFDGSPFHMKKQLGGNSPGNKFKVEETKCI
jgi:hypothetical protein